MPSADDTTNQSSHSEHHLRDPVLIAWDFEPGGDDARTIRLYRLPDPGYAIESVPARPEGQRLMRRISRAEAERLYASARMKMVTEADAFPTE